MTTVLETELRVLPEQEKTNLILPFTLPFDAQKLQITYTYAPKILDGAPACEKAEACLCRDAGEYRDTYPEAADYLPLKNLITLSLDAPDGYRGCAHRQAPQQVHILTENTASPGFLPGKMQKGAWRLMLHVHALVTDFCVCHVKIEAQEAENG